MKKIEMAGVAGQWEWGRRIPCLTLPLSCSKAKNPGSAGACHENAKCGAVSNVALVLQPGSPHGEIDCRWEKPCLGFQPGMVLLCLPIKMGGGRSFGGKKNLVLLFLKWQTLLIWMQQRSESLKPSEKRLMKKLPENRKKSAAEGVSCRSGLTSFRRCLFHCALVVSNVKNLWHSYTFLRLPSWQLFY